jgi:hypothetical protein
VAALLIIRRGRDIVGECDALCYNAKGKVCECRACEGANHGVGYGRAVLNTRRMAAEWAARANADRPVSYELANHVQQYALFEEDT